MSESSLVTAESLVDCVHVGQGVVPVFRLMPVLVSSEECCSDVLTESEDNSDVVAPEDSDSIEDFDVVEDKTVSSAADVLDDECSVDDPNSELDLVLCSEE